MPEGGGATAADRPGRSTRPRPPGPLVGGPAGQCGARMGAAAVLRGRGASEAENFYTFYYVLHSFYTNFLRFQRVFRPFLGSKKERKGLKTW